mgnify:CR=1 FL=1
MQYVYKIFSAYYINPESYYLQTNLDEEDYSQFIEKLKSNNPDATIVYTTSENLTGPYAENSVVVSLAKTGVEGSEIYNITGTDQWVMIMDEYSTDRFFMQQTSDFETFLPINPNDYNMNFSPRHGAITSITDEQYDMLLEHFDI